MREATQVCLAAIATVLVPAAAAAVCLEGGEACPIPVHMKPGTDTITLTNTLKQNVDCCYYSLEARSGQTLTWDFSGPDERSLITYPDGNSDGPGIPNSIPLKTTGTYVLGFVGDTMSDNAFGPFQLTVTIK
jgi:hypothetical protein